MLTIIESLWRLAVLVACAFVQAIAAILGGIGMLFSMGGAALAKASNKILKKLNKGKYEAEMRNIAEKFV